ncbi:MAG: bifunctional precorrin-2 dehydrogenase/sirohydrochlorin ferrochelatase [Deltaproteobacteria bacterium]|nr:bifunctional precorrin-2 dehydrogenase/sirohydrochlorin ferrochelatase [Deltaproteobacteria bacterium]
MRYYPVFLDLQNIPCLVIGGGQVGERKVKTLQSCSAKVYLISRELTPYLREEVQQGRIILLASSYQTEYLKEMFLVIGATDDPELNGKIGREARERRILCNIADKPGECNFILPSLVCRGDLTIAVSTAGKSPALAKKIRLDLEEGFPEIYGSYLEFLGQIRNEVLTRKMSQEENQKIFETLVNSPVLSWLERGELEPLYDFLDRLLNPPFPRTNLTEILNKLFPSLQ